MRKSTTLGILGIFLGLPTILFAQLSVSIQMDPNPSPFLSDWKSDPNTVRLIVTNPTGKSHSVRFKGYIEGDARGRVAETKLDGSIPPVDISPGVSILTAADAHILDKDAVRYIGPTRQEVIQSGRLPDDNFRICVQVVTYDSPHSPLSPEACSRFTVRRLSPPSLIAPADKSTIKAAPTFQWSHVAMGRGNFARYELRLIELSPGQRNIVNAMETGIPLLVRESSLPLYQFLPSDPNLQNGKTYAWRVRAFDPQNKFTFTNDGKSEIRTFTYSSAKLTVVKDITTKKKTTGIKIGIPPNFVFTKLTRIRGMLRTTFYKNSIPAPRSIVYKPSKGKPPLTGNKSQQPGGDKGIKTGKPTTGKPTLATHFVTKKNLPLGGLHLKLYLRTKSNPNCGFFPISAGGKTFDAEKLVATTTTNPDGTFDFIFFAKDSTGRILQNASIQCGSKEFVNSLTADLYRYYQIMVDDPHLLSPSDEFKVQPGEVLDVGTLYSLVRSYSITVSVKDKVKGNQLPNMDVRIVRMNRPYDVPPEEGELKPYQSVEDVFLLKAAKAEVIAQGKTNAEGKATLKYMAKNVGGSDLYHLLVSSPKEGAYYYHTLWKTFEFGFLIGEKDEAGNGLVYDMAVTNEGYNPNFMHAVVLASVKPHKPRIAGRVYRSDNTLQTIKNAKVTLSGFTIGLWPIKTTMTNDSGEFVFDNLKPTGDIAEEKAIFYVVTVEKYGFKKYQSSAIFVEMGQQYYTTIQLEPALTVKGRVIDELGRPVSANVRIGQGEWVHTVKKIKPKKSGKPVVPKKSSVNKVIIKSSSAGLLKNKNLQKKTPIFVIYYDEEFTTPAVTGFRWLFIVPDNQSQYYPETLLVMLPPDADDIGEFTVYIKQHRLAVQAVTVTPKVSKSWKAKSSPNKYVPGTSVKKIIPDAIIRVNDAEPDSIDADGVAYFVWTSPSDNATVRVRGPDNSDYVEKTVSAVIDESKSWTFLEVPLKLGGALSGTVKVGTVPIPGARVALYDNPADASPLQATTDNDGKYILHGIPVGTHVFKAAKSKSQYIGDTAQAAIFKGQTTNLDFQLTAYNDMDITHLLGFPIEIISLDSVGQEVIIAGSFVSLPGNDQFSPFDTTSSLPFDAIGIKPSAETNPQGIPLAEPAVTPVTTTVNEWTVSASGLYKAFQREEVNGIQVRKPAERGEIMGKVLIDPASFTFPGGTINFGSSFLALATALDVPNGMIIPAITSDESTPHNDPRGFFVLAEDGSGLSYALYDFPAESDSSSSFFNQDTLSLATTIHSSISSIENPDIALDIGILRLHKTSVEPLHSTSSLSIPLEADWRLYVESWTIDHNGLTLNSGYADLGPMNVNYTGMKLFPDQLLMGAFDAQNIPIAGIKTLHVTGTADFGIEGGTGHWALAISPSQGKDDCGYLGGFPGLNPQDKIKFQSIYLRATGSKNFTVADGNTVTLYKVGDWKINQFFPTSDLMQVAGNLDLHIPNLPIKNFIATYSKKNNTVVFTPDPIAHTISINGVKIKFVTAGNAPQVFDNQGYHSKVIVSEEGAFALNAMLHRTPAKTHIIVDDGQEVVVGSDPNTKMTAVEGAMLVQNQQWENFWFEGDLQNNNQGGRLRFEVQGDIVANNQEIGVDNIETPFGDIKLVYNFPKERIEGSLHVEKDFSGTKLKGDATLLISGTGKGWYFFCGATFSLPNPKIDGTAAFAVGNYNLEQEQLDQFKQYSYKNQGLPQQFHEFHGFFFEGLAKFPPPVFCPNFDFDFGLVSAYLICQVGANARFGMNFGTVNTYFISIRGIANVEAGVGASIGIACAGLSAGLLIDPYIEGLYQSDGTWYVMGDFPFTLYGSTYVGWGICDSKCCCDLCDKSSASASITLGMKAYVGSDDKYFKFYFK